MLDHPVVAGVFAGAGLNADARRFTTVMKNLVRFTTMYRAYVDWKKVRAAMTRPEEFLAVEQNLRDNYAALLEAYRAARRIVDAYPKSDGARVLREMLEIGHEKQALRDVAALRRKFGEGRSIVFQNGSASDLRPKPKAIGLARLPGRGVKFSPAPYNADGRFLDIRQAHRGRDGLVYLRVNLSLHKSGPGRLLYNADGPFKIWVNGREAGCHPDAATPARHDARCADVSWRKGSNTIVYAIDTNRGLAWCGVGRAVVP